MLPATPHTAPLLCIGGAHLDRTMRPLGPLNPGDSNPVTVATAPGGVARNLAVGLATRGRRVSLISLVGHDADGDTVCEMLADAGVSTDLVLRHEHARTASYTAVLQEDGALALGLADMAIYDELTVDRVMPRVEAADPALLVVDSNLPATTLEAVADATAAPLVAVATSAAKVGRLRGILHRTAALFANQREAAALAGDDARDAERAAQILADAGGAAAFVTCGAEGALVRHEGRTTRCRPAPIGAVCDVTGAGDAFAAAAIDAMLAGEGARQALEAGSAATPLILAEDGAGQANASASAARTP